MNLTKGALNRPIFVFMLVLASILGGTFAYMSMRLELNPDVSFGTVTVSTTYPGASPEDINQLISKKIEDAVSGVSGVREITSTSEEGASIVVLTLELGTDQDAAVNDIRSKVDSIVASLPKDALKPEVIKFDTSSTAVLDLSLASTKLSSRELRDLVDDKLSDKFAQITGVVSVGVSGGDQREVQVRLKRDKLLAYGVGINDIRQAVANASLNEPAGHIVNGTQDDTVRVISQFETPQQVADMIISISDPNDPNAKQKNVRLGDVADVVDSSIERTDYARLDGHDTIAIALQKARDGNSVDITTAANKVIDDIQTQYASQGIRITKTYEDAKQITDSLADLRFSLVFSVLLVSAIVYLFLHNFRGTLIVALAIPTCIFCAFMAMKALGFSINSMSMLSLSLAVGVLVDDAIVVLENIYRHLRLGEDPRDAALNGRAEIGIAAIAITMADVVVWLPIAFMGGIVGQFFKPLALGFVAAVLFSLLISFTLTPLLASRWYKAGEDMEHAHGWFAVGFENLFHRFEVSYSKTLEWALNHRWTVFVIGNGALFAVVSFIAGSFATKAPDAAKGVVPTGLLFLCLFIGLIVFSTNFLRGLPKSTRWKVRFGCLGFGILLAIGSAAVPHSAKGPQIPPAPVVLIVGYTIGMFLTALVGNMVIRTSKYRYLGSALLAGGVFVLFAVAGQQFHQWKGEDVFKFQFLPDTDNGTVTANIQLPPGSSLDATQAVVSLVEAKFRAYPDMKYVLSTVGGQGAGNFNVASSGSNYAQVAGTLYDKESITDRLPWNHHTEKLRTKSDSAAAGILTEQVGRIPGAQISISAAGSGFGANVQLSFTSDNHALLLATAQKVRDALGSGAVKGVINPQLSVNAGKPEIQIRPNRLETADLGLTPQDLATAVEVLYQGNNDTKMRVNGREYGIRVMMDRKDRDNPNIIKEVPLKFSQGQPVYLGSLAQVVTAPGIDRITRRARAEEIEVTADTLPGVAAGTVNQDIQTWLVANHVVPDGVHFKPQGQADAQARESGGMIIAFLMGIVLVYMLLASLYDNLLYPFIIQISQPQAMVGALLALIITNKSLNLVGFIGLVALVGLVGKNAILLVDYTNTLRDRGRSRHDALVEAGPTRLRPIMMTTLALILGMLPVALAIGRGSEFRETIGIIIIGGISLSTLLTLLVIPCSYTIFDDIVIRFARVRHKQPPHTAAAADDQLDFSSPSEPEILR
jgi:HAE1 family hydrophobic/amphiphilic exporter-1